MKLKTLIFHLNIYRAIGLALIIIATFLLFGCEPTTAPIAPTAAPTLAPIDLPQPEQACANPIDWRGIRPGKSTQQDVVNILGEPEDKGYQIIGPNSFPFYTYKVEGGEVAGFATNRVFFRADGVVDWMEVIVGDQDGSYHKVSEIAARLGNILDAVYINSNYSPYHEAGQIQFEVTSGPDQLYVWSNCGIVLDALPVKPIDDTLTTRYPNLSSNADKISLNVNNIILIKFMFIPTSYKGFTDYYMYKTPYLTPIPGSPWNIYIQKIGRANK